MAGPVVGNRGLAVSQMWRLTIISQSVHLHLRLLAPFSFFASAKWHGYDVPFESDIGSSQRSRAGT